MDFNVLLKSIVACCSHSPVGHQFEALWPIIKGPELWSLTRFSTNMSDLVWIFHAQADFKQALKLAIHESSMDISIWA